MATNEGLIACKCFKKENGGSIHTNLECFISISNILNIACHKKLIKIQPSLVFPIQIWLSPRENA